MRLKLILYFLSIIHLLTFTSCSDDEESGQTEDLIISSSQDTYIGVRGTDVSITFSVNAGTVLSSVVGVTPEGEQSFTINQDATSFNGSLEYAIVGDAVLHTEYPITIEASDVNGSRSELAITVMVGPLLASSPRTYEYSREGTTTVDFSGQNERLDQVEAIKVYLKTGDAGAVLSSATLLSAYVNEGGNGAGLFEFNSTKQLRNKSFQPDLDDQFMEHLFRKAEAASTSGAMASNGIAGLIVRENSGNTVLVDANGREFTQLIEKGLMGTVMYNQIFNTYFTDERIGDDVENTNLRTDKNYTDMEHHWDEAFGYWNPPLDFSSNWPSSRENDDRFWSHYSNVVDPFLKTNDAIMNGFIDGRTAIVNNDLTNKNIIRTIVAEQLEIVAAGTAVHYINNTLRSINEGKTGEAFHTLSEAWTFVNAIKYNPDRRLSIESIIEINESDFGADGNFWNVTVDGLNKAKSTLVTAYPELSAAQDDL